MSTSVPPQNIPLVPLERLQEWVLGSQLGDHVWAAFWGWCLLVGTVLDMIGNAVGLPVITGHLVGPGRLPPAAGLPIILSLQLVTVVVAGYQLQSSHWRVWYPELVGRDGPGLSRLAGRVARDWASVAGVATAGVGAGIAVVILDLQLRLAGAYREACDGGLFWFRALQAIFPIGAAIGLHLFRGSNVASAGHVWLEASRATTQSYYSIDVTRLPAQSVVAHLRHDSLRTAKVLALVAGPNGDFRVCDYSAEINLMNQRAVFLVLAALKTAVTDSESILEDAAGWYKSRLRFQVSPRNIEELPPDLRRGLGEFLNAGVLGAFLGYLFNTSNPRQLLNDLAVEAMTEWLADLPARGGVASARSLRDELGLRHLTNAVGTGPFPAVALVDTAGAMTGDRYVLGTGQDPYTRVRHLIAALDGHYKAYRERWEPIEQKQQDATAALPGIFARRLTSRFVAADPAHASAWSAVLACLGLELRVVAFDFKPGTAEQMADHFQQVLASSQAAIADAEAWFRENEGKALEWARTNLKDGIQARQREREIMLRQAPDYLMLAQRSPELFRQLRSFLPGPWSDPPGDPKSPDGPAAPSPKEGTQPGFRPRGGLPRPQESGDG